MTAGLILAAGESRRMGSPKALLDFRGRTFLDTLIDLLGARCSPVIVVLGADAEAIRASSSSIATFVLNPDYRSGMTTSLQAGLRAIPAAADGVLFTLVDHPAVAPETVDALLRPGDAGLIRVPSYHGRRGHPIWFATGLIAEFLALPAKGAAREVVRAHVDQTRLLDLEDPGILADIDDPAAYQSLLSTGPESLPGDRRESGA